MGTIPSMTASIFISAGEASGEFYGAELARALARESTAQAKTAELWGMGGARMAAAGVECIVRAEDMAVMGFTEVVRHLPRIYREFRKLKRAIAKRRPAVAVLIDFPEIHFRLAREFHRLGIPVIYFVSPQLWAWKQHRIRLVQQYVKRMLVIFPFEEKFYRERGVEAEFVGHPLADLAAPAVSRADFAADNGLDAAKTWIGLLPGSRLKEIEANLPEMLEAARGINDIPQGLTPQSSCGSGVSEGANRQAGDKPGIGGRNGEGSVAGAKALGSLSASSYGPAKAVPLLQDPPSSISLASSPGVFVTVPFQSEGLDRVFREGVFQEAEKIRSERCGFEFLVPLAPTLDEAQRKVVARMVEGYGAGLAIRAVEDARAVLLHARASVVASGTATVEAALIGNPFVVVYRVSRLTYAIARRLVKVPHVAMANLIAGRRVVPELIQHDFTAANIVQSLRPLLPDGPARESMMKELGAIREALHVHPASGQDKCPSAIATVAAIVSREMEAARPAAVEAMRR